MLPPKKYTSIDAWFVQAKRALGRLRGEVTNIPWVVEEELISTDTIMLKLTNKDGQKASIVIERRGTMSKAR